MESNGKSISPAEDFFCEDKDNGEKYTLCRIYSSHFKERLAYVEAQLDHGVNPVLWFHILPELRILT
jgi:hypothetical protein